MKSAITTRFLWSNLLTAALLLFIGWLNEPTNSSIGLNKLSVGMSCLAFLLAIVGIPANAVVAYEIGKHKTSQLTFGEQVFMGFLYLAGFAGNALLFSPFASLIIFNPNLKPFEFLLLIIFVAAFILLILEIHLLSSTPKISLTSTQIKVAKLIAGRYNVFAIGFLWHYLAAGILGQQLNGWTIFQAIPIFVITYLPYQRLYWYEAFCDAKSTRDNALVYLSLILVIAAGIGSLWV